MNIEVTGDGKFSVKAIDVLNTDEAKKILKLAKEIQGTTMKLKKPLKMFVPWGATVDDQDIIELLKHYRIRDNVNYSVATLTPAEIHELVKAHAENLEYWREENDPWKYDAELICLWSDGQITLSNKDDLLNDDLEELKNFQEISPFDFLKLTPEDVEVLNFGKDTLEGLARDVMANDQPITDRNEKAWELSNDEIRIILSGLRMNDDFYRAQYTNVQSVFYYKEDSRKKSMEFYNKLMNENMRLLIRFDNYLKQAGNK